VKARPADAETGTDNNSSSPANEENRKPAFRRDNDNERVFFPDSSDASLLQTGHFNESEAIPDDVEVPNLKFIV